MRLARIAPMRWASVLSATVLSASVLLIAGCSRPPDALAGRWDVSDPESQAKGHVTVGTFGEGAMSLERRGVVMGIGNVSISTTGTYEVSGSEISLTNTETRVDAADVKNAKVREETVRILAANAKRTEGQKRTYTLKIVSPDRLVLTGPTGSMTLTRAR